MKRNPKIHFRNCDHDTNKGEEAIRGLDEEGAGQTQEKNDRRLKQIAKGN